MSTLVTIRNKTPNTIFVKDHRDGTETESVRITSHWQHTLDSEDCELSITTEPHPSDETSANLHKALLKLIAFESEIKSLNTQNADLKVVIRYLEVRE